MVANNVYGKGKRVWSIYVCDKNVTK